MLFSSIHRKNINIIYKHDFRKTYSKNYKRAYNEDYKNILIKQSYKNFKKHFELFEIKTKNLKQKNLIRKFGYSVFEENISKNIFEKKTKEYIEIKKQLKNLNNFEPKFALKEKKMELDIDKIYEQIKEKIFDEIFMMSGGIY